MPVAAAKQAQVSSLFQLFKLFPRDTLAAAQIEKRLARREDSNLSLAHDAVLLERRLRRRSGDVASMGPSKTVSEGASNRTVRGENLSVGDWSVDGVLVSTRRRRER